MNYHPVATVTPHMQKPPCGGSGGEKRKKKGDLWDLIVKNRWSDEWKGKEGGSEQLKRGKKIE